MRRPVVFALLVLGLLLGGSLPRTPVHAQDIPPEVLTILNSMTPEARVGQLFLVTFQGSSAAPESDIYNLITEYQIGGVVLSQANDNFDDREALAEQTARLTRELQQAAATTASSENSADLTPSAPTSPPIPLWIGVAHTGDVAGQTSQFLSTLTALPSAMSIGATWSPEQAEAVGEVVGRELSALGFNMLIGPSLSVLDVPNPDLEGNIGTRSFGGSAYWVGRMGQAYIAGVHAGANQQMLVVARDFPGLGSGDRSLTQDIPTINRTFEQLLQIELVPYFAVTAGSAEPISRADALMLTPARYSGLQGTLTSNTRPLMFDQTAITQLLDRPELVSWRTDGGLLVSEALGLRAVQRYYSSTPNLFPTSTVALDAFLAGSDLLYIDQFNRTAEEPQPVAVRLALSQFAQKYREDPLFAARVDASVARILTAKWQMYGSFDPNVTTPTAVLPDVLGQSEAVTLQVARQAASLIYPDVATLATRLPRPPAAIERIVFITDTQVTRQCSLCAPVGIPAVDALRRAVIRLYGSSGTGQVRTGNLTSYTFAELNNFLSGIPPTPAPDQVTAEPELTLAPSVGVGDDLSRATWVVIGLQDATNPNNAFRRLLAERPDLLRNKQVIVFAFGAPYYLTSSEVVQLTAYYALYGRTSGFVETAARILFQEVAPSAASPVSIASAGYDLPTRLLPASTQRIRIQAELVGIESSPTPAAEGVTPTPSGTALAPIETGQAVRLFTAPILDQNGHIVPDQTQVQFTATYRPQGVTEVIGEVSTVNGVAQLIFNPTVPGLQEIRARSGTAIDSDVVQIVVPSEELEGSAPTILTPTATSTPEPSPTPTLEPSPTATATTDDDGDTPPPPTVNWGQFVAALAAIGILGGVGWQIGDGRAAISNRVKLVLAVIIGVLLGYNYWALGAPGVDMLVGVLPGGAVWGAAVLSWMTGFASLVAAWIWLYRD